MNIARFLAVTVLLVFLTGCSRVQLLYGQLDWLIPYYLETYMKFSDKQRAVLDRRVDALLTWHCRTQLGLYADLLRYANTDFQAGTMTSERIGEYSTQLEGFWRALMVQASPAVADLLLTASDEQIEGLFTAFKEKNETWLAEFNDQSDGERREQYRERMTEELERWFGPLNPKQQQAVREWSRRLTPLGLEGLRSRQRWQANLRDVIGDRANETAFREGIDELFVKPRVLRSPDIQKRFDANRVLALDLVYQIGAHMDGEQRKQLANQTASFAGDLEDLVCVPEPAGARKQDVKRPGTPPDKNLRSDP